MIKFLNTLFVTMFGLGKIPKIPGTFGSLATVIILYIFFHILDLSSNLILLILVIIFIFSFSAITAHTKDIENKDPREIIIDEFIGQSIPIYLYEISHGTEKSSDEAIFFYGVCFILFRFFDIDFEIKNKFLNSLMIVSFQFGLEKIADAFQKRAEDLFGNTKN